MARPSADQYTSLTDAPIQSGSAMIVSSDVVAGAAAVAPANASAWTVNVNANRQGFMNLGISVCATVLSKPASLIQQWVPFGQLMRMPGWEPVPNCLLPHLIFRHRRNDLVVHEQAIDVQRLDAQRVCRLELHRAAALGILNARKQRRFK